MDIYARFAVIGGTAMFVAFHSWACLTASPPASGPKVERRATEYQTWVDRYARPDFAGRNVGSAPDQLKLVVTSVTGDDKEIPKDQRAFLGSGILVAGTELTSDGHVRHFSRSDYGTKGGSGGDPISGADLKRLDELLAKLPDDGAHLPPAGRRMLLRTTLGDCPVARVYDRANAPESVWEILRLSRCGIASWVPEFRPQSEIVVSRHQHGGFLRLSPDGSQILCTSANGPLQFWEPATHEFLAEVRRPGIHWEDIAFSPDGTLAAVVTTDCQLMETKTWKSVRKLAARSVKRRTYGFSSPQFIQDGRYLLLQSSAPALWIFDVRTWERVDRLPEIPEDAVQFVSSPTGKLAVVRSREGSISLWSVSRRDEIVGLDEGGFISKVSFSPDETLIALATTKQQNGQAPGIRIWRTSTGELVHQLRPFEHSAPDLVEGLVWSPDGRYVLAATRPRSFWTSRSISVFSVATGRHRGDFVGCPTDVVGMALLPEHGRLVAGCNDGKIRFWDLDRGLKQIADFESSLKP